ncbi:MAG: DUF5666 domain-containing protein [Anaerolineales bacterium]
MLKKIVLSVLAAMLAAGSLSGLAMAAIPAKEVGDKDARLVYGEVIAVEEDSFRVMTFQGEELSFFVDEETRFRKGTFADLKPGVKVAVAARVDEETAIIVAILPPDFEPGGRFAIRVRGTVTAVDSQAGKFRIQTPDGEILTFFVDEKTHYGGQLGDLSDMQVGWKAGVTAREGEEGKKVATVVIAGERPAWIKLRGTVTAVDSQAGKFRIQTPDGEILTFFVDEKTRYGGQLGDLSDMQVGWKAGVAAREGEEGKKVATVVIAGEPRHGIKARGEITAVDVGLGKFRLKKADGTVLTFFVDDATRFKGQAHGIGDLQVGWKAGVAAVEGEDGHWLARLVIAGEPRAERPLNDPDHPDHRGDFGDRPWGRPAEGQPDA